MKKQLVLLAALFILAACGGNSPQAGSQPVIRYEQVQLIMDGNITKEDGASLTLSADGAGKLNLNLSGEGAHDVVVDPESMVICTVDEGEKYPFETEGDLLSLFYSPDTVYVFAAEEKGFDIKDIRGDALAAADIGSSETSSDDGWIHIASPEDFLHISDDLAGRYILDADINDWEGGISTVFSPIGSLEMPFTGELNGNGHTLTGTLAYSGEEESWGFFACNEGYIHDLTIGHVRSDELDARYQDNCEKDITYASVDNEGFPLDHTRYYSVLCGVNRGRIKNITFEDHTYFPDWNLFPNENDHISLGLVTGRNEGTISDISFDTPYFSYRTFDKQTAVALGTVCGEQSASGVLENITLIQVNMDIDSWGKALLNAAPVLSAGLLVGEAEGNTTIRNIGNITNCFISAVYSLADADISLGGMIGHVHGDIELSGINMQEQRVSLDARTDEREYAPTASVSHSCAGLIGKADGSVTLSDIHVQDTAVNLILREGGNPQPSYTGGMVGACTSVFAENVTLSDSFVSANCEEGVAIAGGLCGYCDGTARVSDSTFSVRMSPTFSGNVLYESNVLGYVCGDASFLNVNADCGKDEFTSESNAHAILAASGRTYYLAALAGAAEAAVNAENCVVDVHYNVIGSGAAIFGAESSEGLYNIN